MFCTDDTTTTLNYIWHMTHDTWHMPHDTWHMHNIIWSEHRNIIIGSSINQRDSCGLQLEK
jgi:cephalosporin hydroxylase